MKAKSLIALMMFLFLAQAAFAENFFSTCRFHWGAGGASGALLNEIDYMTGWAGSSESFNMSSLFSSCKTNNKTPVIIDYIIAFTARRDLGLQDCNVGTPNLCQQGANYMRQNMPRILSQHVKYAKGAEQYFGSAGKMIWCMEPDYTQYSESSQTGGGLTAAQAGTYMNQILDTILAYAPNSVFSMDISPWKDTTFYNTWYAAMKVKERFLFVNTSGGQSTPGSIYFSNQGAKLPTWKWVFQRFGTPTIADAGYGVGGAADPSGYAAWMVLANLTARIPEGCIAVCQNSAPSTYANDIIAIRSKLPTPPKCPSGTGINAPFESRDNAALNLKSMSNGKLEIIDLSGRTVFSKEFTSNNLSWDSWKAGGLRMRPGAYIARMQGNSQSLQKKLLINE
jgi:hypothetical protein